VRDPTAKTKTRLKFQLDEVKAVFNKWLFLEDDRIIDVALATHIANRFAADPVWTLIISPPSTTKTEVLRGFQGHSDAYFLSTLTPSTFISGKKTKNNNEASLLFKLSEKTLILKDFTTILSMRHEPRAEILAQLREIYDGNYVKAFGTGQTVSWEGRVGLIAACTPIYDKHYAVIGSMGDRFITYRCPENDNRKMGIQAQKIVGHEDQMRDEIRSAVHRFIDQFSDVSSIHFKKSTDELNEMIVALACFCALARTPVDRDYKTGMIEYQPMPEGSGRLTKQLTQIGLALALIHQKNRIDEEIYHFIKKIGADLVPTQRIRILKDLFDSKAIAALSVWRHSKDVAVDVNMPTNTAKRILEDMMVVGAVNRDIDGMTDSSPYRWQLTQGCSSLIFASEVFE